MLNNGKVLLRVKVPPPYSLAGGGFDNVKTLEKDMGWYKKKTLNEDARVKVIQQSALNADREL